MMIFHKKKEMKKEITRIQKMFQDVCFKLGLYRPRRTATEEQSEVLFVSADPRASAVHCLFLSKEGRSCTLIGSTCSVLYLGGDLAHLSLNYPEELA